MELEPRVTKRDRKLQLSYESPKRIHCSRIYPLAAPNGSTIILYGHQRGLSVLWRGGRRWREERTLHSTSQARNDNHDNDVILIDDKDDSPTAHRQADPDDVYDESEDEQDADHSFPSVLGTVDYESDAEILRISTPAFSSFTDSDIPKLAKTHMLVAAATSDSKVLLLTIPMELPRSDSIQQLSLEELNPLELEGDGTFVHDLSVKVIVADPAKSAQTKTRSKSKPSDGQLLVAAVASALNLWSLTLRSDSLSSSEKELLPIVHSPISGCTVSFHPSPKSGYVLLANRTGIVRLYDMFATRSANDTTTAALLPSAPRISQEHHGRWVLSLYTPFQTNAASPALARRKKILSSAWILQGRGLLVLLEDGEWGIWDLFSSSSNTGKSLEDFALRGYLDSSSAAEVADSSKPKKTGSKLAPMTPNTRKAKAENLFTGPRKVPGVAASGGISICSRSNRSGKTDESLIIWYNGEVYSISSMQTFWQRSVSSSTSGGLGSLHAPGLTHITDLALMNENITSISQFQFGSASWASSLGQMNTQKDLLVSAEHRLIILQQLRPTSAAGKRLFQQALAERPAHRDQQMLDVGELAVDGMDRMLDSMMADDARPMRRVGFAH